MKIIPRFFHGILDYMSGLLLLAAPNLFGFAGLGGATVWIPRIIGVMILLQALMTDYELGIMKLIPMRMHLTADYVIGGVLLVAPFISAMSARSIRATVLMLVMALVAFAAPPMTQPRGRPREIMP